MHANTMCKHNTHAPTALRHLYKLYYVLYANIERNRWHRLLSSPTSLARANMDHVSPQIPLTPISIYPSLLSAIYPSLLSAYTPHPYQQYTPHSYQHLPLTPISIYPPHPSPINLSLLLATYPHLISDIHLTPKNINTPLLCSFILLLHHHT